MNNPATLKELFECNNANKIVLPDFQRPLEWKTEKQQRLLASCLVDLSIGSLLFLEGSKDDFPARRIGISKSAHITPENECFFLLDGQQRLTSVRSFFSDFFDGPDWTSVFDEIFPQLRRRWFLSLEPKSQSGEDVFGFRKLKFVTQMDLIEPEVIAEHIESRPLFKTKEGDWWHPSYDDTEFESACARERLIPLYNLEDILKNRGHNCIRRIIRRISDTRREDIISDISRLSVVEAREAVSDCLVGIDETKLEAYSDVSSMLTDFKDGLDDLRAEWCAETFKYFESIWTHKISLMILAKEQVARAIATFTAINEGGQKLSTFDLIVAKAAKNSDIPSLPQRIRSKVEENFLIPQSLVTQSPNHWSLLQAGAVKDNAIEKWFQDAFINMISGLAWSEYDASNPFAFINRLRPEHFKSAKQLVLSCEQINATTDLALRLLQRAIAFLQFRCGIVSGSDVHYQLMIFPVAFALLQDSVWTDPSKINRLEVWYWTSLFSGSYREGQNERCYQDIKLLIDWLWPESTTEETRNQMERRKNQMFQQSNYCDEATFTMSADADPVPIAMHAACLQYVLSTNPPDFLPEDMWEKEKLFPWRIARAVNLGESCKGTEKLEGGNTRETPIQLKPCDHHIFPLGASTKIGESSKKIRNDRKHPLNSPMNRTYISTTANSLISDKLPEQYLPQVMGIAKNFHFATEHQASEFQAPNYVFFRLLLKERYEKFTDAVRREIEQLDP